LLGRTFQSQLDLIEQGGVVEGVDQLDLAVLDLDAIEEPQLHLGTLGLIDNGASELAATEVPLDERRVSHDPQIGNRLLQVNEVGPVLLQRLFEERLARGHVRVHKAHLRIDDNGVGVDQRVVRLEVLLGIGAKPFPDGVLDFARVGDAFIRGFLLHSFSFEAERNPSFSRWPGAGTALNGILFYAKS
jgi:hypothetical protein